MTPRHRPGRLWLFFYGRRRRGFPWLLAGLVVAALALGTLFGLPLGADLSRLTLALALGALALLILGSIAVAVIAALGPRRRGRR